MEFNILKMRKTLEKFDNWLIYIVRKISTPFARFALFVIFFWFGILKLIGTSPANPMVQSLQEATLPFMTWGTFIIIFSIYEVIIGLAFVIPRLERLAIALLIPHLIMTSLPLFFLPALTWQGFLTPSMEGQYIIKNLVILAVALGIAAHLHPIRNNK